MQEVVTTVAQLQRCGGMGYVIQLADGRFIIIDGGEAATEKRCQANKDILYAYLRQRTVGDKIRIACWLITHFHSDHTDVATQFIQEYNHELEIERFVFNYVPTVEFFNKEMQLHELSREQNWTKAMECYPRAERIEPKSGDCLTISNAKIHILATANDPYPEKSPDPNYSSMVVKILFDNGKSFMLLGDAMGRRLTALIDPTASIYCSDEVLKSDILQAAHHGFRVSENEDDCPLITQLYQKIAPKIVFFAQNEHCFYTREWLRNPEFTYHKFLLDSARERNFNQSYTTIVDMDDLSITFEKKFIEND